MCIGPVGLAETYSHVNGDAALGGRAPVILARLHYRGEFRPPGIVDQAHVDEAGPGNLHRRDLGQLLQLGREQTGECARGFVPAGFASTMAALVARSPCVGSRGGSTVTAAWSSPRGSCPEAASRSSAAERCAA
jgi:hypothetical protein